MQMIRFGTETIELHHLDRVSNNEINHSVITLGEGFGRKYKQSRACRWRW